ncbi:MAG: IS3 family transposase [Actinomycetota bacterium]|nr:IS3 family transposase [Actinomycetota bacterium]
MIYAFIAGRCADLPVTACCSVMKVSTSGFYEWKQRQSDPCRRQQQDAELTETITQIWRQSRGTYGSPRVWAELKLGENIRVGRKRVERLMRQAGIEGLYRRRRQGCTSRDPEATPSDDLVKRRFHPTGPDRLWIADITEHPTREGKVYCAVVIDAWSRRVVGWSIADHLRAELVCDALDMAIWRRRPKPDAGLVHHADHGTQYTSWAFGQRLRNAGLLGSMGTVGDALDNAMAESFFGTLQLELLDRHHWETRRQLAQAIFEYIEAFYNPERRHSSINYMSPIDYETSHNRPAAVA